MRVALLHNPSAGRGRGEAKAREIARALGAAGHEVRGGDVRADAGGLPGLVNWAEAVVVVGGDGTLHHLLPVLAGCGRGVYHAGTGTENLFARELGHRADPRWIVAALAEGCWRDLDVGELRVGGEGRLFAIMASMGPDASVVHRLDASRTGAISHASYLGPALAELRGPSLPRTTVMVDGREIVRDQPGMLVVGNMRSYALGVNPCASARSDDGLLDAVFIPARSGMGALAGLAACRLRMGGRLGAVLARGARVEWTGVGPCPIQADGEAVRWRDQTKCDRTAFVGEVSPRKLRVVARK